MNASFITSFVIGGMVLLSILAMNFSISQNNTELAISRNVKQHVSTVADMISHDIPKIGSNWMGKINNPISTADSNKIVFFSNIDNDTASEVEKITWTYGNSGVSSTPNPNDYVLTRHTVQGGVTVNKSDIDFGVTKFRIKYYSTIGGQTPMATPVANPENIRQIEVELVLESANKYRENFDSDGRYIKSAWTKRFSPINLRD